MPFLGRIPVDPRIVTTGDAGRPLIATYPNSQTAEAFEKVVRNVINVTLALTKEKEEKDKGGN